MVLEDLKIAGFINIDRKAGLSVLELKITIIHLAKMHAASVSANNDVIFQKRKY